MIKCHNTPGDNDFESCDISPLIVEEDRLNWLNAYLKEFPLDIEGQESTPLPVDKIMDIIYHAMPTT